MAVRCAPGALDDHDGPAGAAVRLDRGCGRVGSAVGMWHPFPVLLARPSPVQRTPTGADFCHTIATLGASNWHQWPPLHTTK